MFTWAISCVETIVTFTIPIICADTLTIACGKRVTSNFWYMKKERCHPCQILYWLWSLYVQISFILKHTANVCRDLRGVYREIRVQGFQIYRDCRLPTIPAIFFSGKTIISVGNLIYRGYMGIPHINCKEKNVSTMG